MKINVLAYCIIQAAEAVRKALDVEPLTCPPTHGLTPGDLSGRDLVYIRLHGSPQFPGVWFGEDESGSRFPALTIEDVRAADLSGAVVIAASCYGADSEFPAAFYAAGAALVVAGSGPNFAAGNRVIGADLLAQTVLKSLAAGIKPEKSVTLAKARLCLSSYRAADRDTQQFKIIKRLSK